MAESMGGIHCRPGCACLEDTVHLIHGHQLGGGRDSMVVTIDLNESTIAATPGGGGGNGGTMMAVELELVAATCMVDSGDREETGVFSQCPRRPGRKLGHLLPAFTQA